MKWRNEVNVDLSAERVSYYYTFDHLRSVRELTNSSGTIQARYDYDPYGRTTLVSGTNLSDKQYAGMYIHQASGLDLTKYRAYDPNTARWLCRDPIGENGGLDLYVYVLDNPVCAIDRMGLDEITVTHSGGEIENLDPISSLNHNLGKINPALPSVLNSVHYAGGIPIIIPTIVSPDGPEIVFENVCPSGYKLEPDSVSLDGSDVVNIGHGGWTIKSADPAANRVEVNITTRGKRGQA
jgi:RHS repeat-associated protein